MTNYDEKISMLVNETQITTENVDVDKLIIDNTAQNVADFMSCHQTALMSCL